MIKKSRRPVFIVIVCAILLAGCTGGNDYVDMLKEKNPGYERHISGHFAPMWEPMARQMVQEYGLGKGIAVDIGSSSSPFLIELAALTEMRGYAVDINPWALRLLGVFVDEAGLTGRVIPVEGDWQDLPFSDNFADFIFSRGTIPFVPDQVQAIRETYRVLKPGGIAFIGHGGFGTLIDQEDRELLVQWRLGWDAGGRDRPEGWDGPKEGMTELAMQAGLPDGSYKLITESPVGWWLEIRK